MARAAVVAFWMALMGCESRTRAATPVRSVPTQRRAAPTPRRPGRATRRRRHAPDGATNQRTSKGCFDGWDCLLAGCGNDCDSTFHCK